MTSQEEHARRIFSSLIAHHSLNSFNDARRGRAFDEVERENSAARALNLFAAVYLAELVIAALD